MYRFRNRRGRMKLFLLPLRKKSGKISFVSRPKWRQSEIIFTLTQGKKSRKNPMYRFRNRRGRMKLFLLPLRKKSRKSPLYRFRNESRTKSFLRSHRTKTRKKSRLCRFQNRGYSERKEFAPSGSKFFPLRAAPMIKGELYFILHAYSVRNKHYASD